MDKQLDKMFESTNSYTPESPDRVTSPYEPSSVDQKGGEHCSTPHHLWSKSSVSTPITPTVTQDKDINYYQGRPLIRSQDIPSQQLNILSSCLSICCTRKCETFSCIFSKSFLYITRRRVRRRRIFG
jgi:hypothetical protein